MRLVYKCEEDWLWGYNWKLGSHSFGLRWDWTCSPVTQVIYCVIVISCLICPHIKSYQVPVISALQSFVQTYNNQSFKAEEHSSALTCRVGLSLGNPPQKIIKISRTPLLSACNYISTSMEHKLTTDHGKKGNIYLIHEMLLKFPFREWCSCVLWNFVCPLTCHRLEGVHAQLGIQWVENLIPSSRSDNRTRAQGQSPPNK